MPSKERTPPPPQDGSGGAASAQHGHSGATSSSPRPHLAIPATSPSIGTKFSAIMYLRHSAKSRLGSGGQFRAVQVTLHPEACILTVSRAPSGVRGFTLAAGLSSPRRETSTSGGGGGGGSSGTTMGGVFASGDGNAASGGGGGTANRGKRSDDDAAGGSSSSHNNGDELAGSNISRASSSTTGAASSSFRPDPPVANAGSFASAAEIMSPTDRSCIAQVVLDLSSVVCESAWIGPDLGAEAATPLTAGSLAGSSFEVFSKPTGVFEEGLQAAVAAEESVRQSFMNARVRVRGASNDSTSSSGVAPGARTSGGDAGARWVTAVDDHLPPAGSRRRRNSSAGSAGSVGGAASSSNNNSGSGGGNEVDTARTSAREGAHPSSDVGATSNAAVAELPSAPSPVEAPALATVQRAVMLRGAKAKVRLTLCCANRTTRDEWIAALSRCALLQSPFVVDSGTTLFLPRQLQQFDESGEQERKAASRKIHELRQALLFSETTTEDQALDMTEAMDQNAEALTCFLHFHSGIIHHLANEPERALSLNMLTLQLLMTRLSRTTAVPTPVLLAVFRTAFEQHQRRHRSRCDEENSMHFSGVRPSNDATSRSGRGDSQEGPWDVLLHGLSAGTSPAEFASSLPRNDEDTEIGSQPSPDGEGEGDEAVAVRLLQAMAPSVAPSTLHSLSRLAAAMVERCAIVIAMKRLQHTASVRMVQHAGEHLRLLQSVCRLQRQADEQLIAFSRNPKHRARVRLKLKKALTTGLPVTIQLPDKTKKGLLCRIGLVKPGPHGSRAGRRRSSNASTTSRNNSGSSIGSGAVASLFGGAGAVLGSATSPQNGDGRDDGVIGHGEAQFLAMLPPHRGTLYLLFFEDGDPQSIFQRYRLVRGSSIKIKNPCHSQLTTVADRRGNRCRLDFVWDSPVDCHHFYVRVRGVILALREKYRRLHSSASSSGNSAHSGRRDHDLPQRSAGTVRIPTDGKPRGNASKPARVPVRAFIDGTAPFVSSTRADWLLEDFHDVVRADTVISSMETQFKHLLGRLRSASHTAVAAGAPLLSYSPDRVQLDCLWNLHRSRKMQAEQHEMRWKEEHQRFHNRVPRSPDSGGVRPAPSSDKASPSLLSVKAQLGTTFLDERSLLGAFVWQWLGWLRGRPVADFWNPAQAVLGAEDGAAARTGPASFLSAPPGQTLFPDDTSSQASQAVLSARGSSEVCVNGHGSLPSQPSLCGGSEDSQLEAVIAVGIGDDDDAEEDDPDTSGDWVTSDGHALSHLPFLALDGPTLVHHTKQTILSVMYHFSGLLLKQLMDVVSALRHASAAQNGRDAPEAWLTSPRFAAAGGGYLPQSPTATRESQGAVPMNVALVVDVRSISEALTLLNPTLEYGQTKATGRNGGPASTTDRRSAPVVSHGSPLAEFGSAPTGLDERVDPAIHTLAVFSNSLQDYVALFRSHTNLWSVGNRIKWDVASLSEKQHISLLRADEIVPESARNSEVTEGVGFFDSSHDRHLPPMPSLSECRRLITRSNVWRLLARSVFLNGGDFLYTISDTEELVALDRQFRRQVRALSSLRPQDFGVEPSHIIVHAAGESVRESEIEPQFPAVCGMLSKLGWEDDFSSLSGRQPSFLRGVSNGNAKAQQEGRGDGSATRLSITLNPFLFAEFLRDLVLAIQEDLAAAKAANEARGIKKTADLTTDAVLSILIYALCQAQPLRPHLTLAVCIEYGQIINDYYADVKPASSSSSDEELEDGESGDDSRSASSAQASRNDNAAALVQYATVSLCSALNWLCTVDASPFKEPRDQGFGSNGGGPSKDPPSNWRSERNGFDTSAFETYMYPSSENARADYESTNEFITRLQRRLS